jgi:hypothetical protein
MEEYMMQRIPTPKTPVSGGSEPIVNQANVETSSFTLADVRRLRNQWDREAFDHLKLAFPEVASGLSAIRSQFPQLGELFREVGYHVLSVEALIEACGQLNLKITDQEAATEKYRACLEKKVLGFEKLSLLEQGRIKRAYPQTQIQDLMPVRGE